ncbi:GntR family transcriptional regulator [Metabacillus fastidiosus]|uniref:GntR family transcriptional regulator n=1 Tax=Metabacillus fastidiosus TaxID=1458 RepID=UPI002DBC9113|nr:GntR family transcriptional regulator [Metabacillus fastidiosus]MEC2076637.1 GntR family transcriptional regulator [Metabacillus fastidiosus]MED4531678.1 GntR family transcriptional regulator [Metabacillus fastidiosus]
MNSKESEIYKQIKQAIIHQKLRPNTQLVEKEIAETFGVSRTPVRNVLRRLSYERLVKIIENKGAFVACSSVEEAKEVFEMRRILEAQAVRRACRLSTKEQIDELEKMVQHELKIYKDLDYIEAIQMSGDFHLKVAELAGNTYFYKYLEDLINLTYVIISIYGRGNEEKSTCLHHLHIFDAIKQRDEDLAERLATEHLQEIEENLHFNEELQIPASFSEIFDQG